MLSYFIRRLTYANGIRKHMKNIKSIFYLFIVLGLVFVVSCSDDDPTPTNGEEEEEEITRVALTFTPDNGEEAVVATWFDEDGEGTGAPVIDEIELEEGVTYTMTMTLTNTLGTEDEDITAEIEEEDADHMFFFAFTDGYFSSPEGDGNIDNRADAINYNDTDANGLPVGLSTTWTAGEHSEVEGEFRVILKHQPDEKTETSDIAVGGTDFDITFPLHIEADHNHEEEVINEIVLTFTPTGGGDAIAVKWFDEDGEGVGNPTIDDIVLTAETTYEMSIKLANTLGTVVEDITAEIEAEGADHMFFFEFTTDIFSNPAGNGNVDNRDDAINYNDKDVNDLPIGLSTNWTAGAATSDAGKFRVVLKHQPNVKTATSAVADGSTDIDIEFNISIQ